MASMEEDGRVALQRQVDLEAVHAAMMVCHTKSLSMNWIFIEVIVGQASGASSN
jgi:hypothetical protein